jgi:hypothetical protein
MVVFMNKCNIKTVCRTNMGQTEIRSVILDLDIKVNVKDQGNLKNKNKSGIFNNSFYA